LEKIRFGIVGCGVIAPFHARGVTNAPDAELVAVCDIIQPRADKLSADFGGAAVYTDYREMLAAGGVDAVCVCVPSGLHGQVTIDAAKAGKHVMCEKPIEITLDKIDAMVAACEQAKVKLGVIFQRRTSPVWHKIKKTIDDGKLGKMVLGDAYLKYYRSQEYYDSGDWRGTWELDGGGALMNQGVHMIDLLRWIMGPIDTVYAKADHLVRNIEVEDTACAVMQYASGAFGVLEGTTSVVKMDHRMELHGEIGTIVASGEKVIKWEVPGDDSGGQVEKQVEIGSAASDPTAISTEGHTIQIHDLCRAIIEDREPMIPGREARKAVEVILAIYESARTGLPVKMSQKV
jgi:UDP-N-acetyl-2-amino-2-deoxyglucuronate dehydrogenase